MNGEGEKTEEPLGSVTQMECSSPGTAGIPVRSSARVSKKLRLDSLSKPVSQAPTTDKKDGAKEEGDSTSKKQDSKCKKMKSHNWSAQGKDIFFEALNEYGKDFDAIQRYFVMKSKKKTGSDFVMKTKEQIRHFYYRTWAKISKHLKFPPDIKKQTQELYGLINYGEFRKKMGCVTEKTSLKLNELVIRGFTQLRVKGKNVHIRTPRCRTLRRLNQLEESQDEIKLPSRIHVELVPRNNETWARVQSTAQNPCVQVVVPLQYRLTSLLQFLQKRWLPRHDKYKNQMMKNCHIPNNNGEEDGEFLIVAPKPNAQIHISNVNLGQHLTSTRICLSSHEKRLGRKAECEEILKTLKAESRGKGKKQQKAEEKEAAKKQSPDGKKSDPEEAVKLEDAAAAKVSTEILSSSGKEKPNETAAAENIASPSLANEQVPKFSFGVPEPGLAVHDTNDDCNESHQTEVLTEDLARHCETNAKNEKMPDFLEGLMKIQNKDEQMAKIRNGWSLKNSLSLAVGDLYLMLGSDCKLQLEYWWKKSDETTLSPTESNVTKLGTMLLKLVRLTKLLKSKSRLACPCGHRCGDDAKICGSSSNSTRGRRPLGDEGSKETASSNHQGGLQNNDSFFRKPTSAPCTKSRLDPEAFKAQLDKLTPRYCNRRGRGIAAKNVVVQRTLPLLPKANNGHAIVTLKLIPQTSHFLTEPVPISIMSSAAAATSPGTLGGETVRKRTELPIAPKPPVASDEKEPIRIERPPPSPAPSLSALLEDHDPMMEDMANSDNNFTGLTGSFECSGILPPSPSPTVILREEDWLNAEVADYSLSSILGHLETPVKSNNCQNFDTASEVETQFQYLMTETSMDFVAKFEDLAAKISSDNGQ